MSASPSGNVATSPASPLLPEHEAAGAVLTSFAGWTMPLRFGSELAEHRAVRQAAGLFDLSHMAQLEVRGSGAGGALDRALVSVVSAMPPGRARYTMLTGPDGGVLDDVVVYRLAEDSFLLVANAANRHVVLEELEQRARGAAVELADRTEERALIAVQGPRAQELLQPETDVDLDALRYYRAATGTAGAAPAIVARTGYTGEDGFEVSVPAAAAAGLWRALRGAGAVPCGLAARDTLRLEAGMALYGHELTARVTPFDAGLDRVVDLGHEFVGRDALAARAAAPGGRRLVGLVGAGRRAARAGNRVLVAGEDVGEVTSGALSPTLGRPIAMALLEPAPPVGTRVDVDVRGVLQSMDVVALPFYRRRPAVPPPPAQEAQ